MSTHRYATAGSIEQLAVAYRSLAAQAEMPIDEIIELAVADKLWIAVRRATSGDTDPRQSRRSCIPEP